MREDFGDWLSGTANRDSVGQYRTQLASLADVLRPALRATRERFVAECDGLPDGDAYEECRRVDRRVVRLRRLWRWYADRFDQRLDDALAPTLLAADEVVWSCWSAACRMADPTATPGPAPLPYVEAVQTAIAGPRSEVPADLRLPGDPVLREFVARMPVPTIALPPIVTRRPWWLIVVAHEVGHHVQSELLDTAAATGAAPALAGAVGAAAGRAGAGLDEQESWGLWAREAYADAFAFVATGTATTWAVEELERRSDKLLATSAAPNYPPPVVRWALLTSIARVLRVDGGLEPAVPDPGAAPVAVRDLLARVPAVVDALLDAPLGGSSLRAFGAGTRRWERAAMVWRSALRDEAEPDPVHTDEAARLCVAGGVHAWRGLTATATPTARQRDALARRLRETAAGSRVDGWRAAADGPAPDLERLARELADELQADGSGE